MLLMCVCLWPHHEGLSGFAGGGSAPKCPSMCHGSGSAVLGTHLVLLCQRLGDVGQETGRVVLGSVRAGLQVRTVGRWLVQVAGDGVANWQIGL